MYINANDMAKTWSENTAKKLIQYVSHIFQRMKSIETLA